MDTLNISKENALKAYQEGTAKQRELLINLFGKKVFQLNVFERILTFKDACEETGNDPDKEYSEFDTCRIIVKALNEGFVADNTNKAQSKYSAYLYNWDETDGFAVVDFNRWYTDAIVPSCLCLENSEKALFFGKQFKKELTAYLLLQ